MDNQSAPRLVLLLFFFLGTAYTGNLNHCIYQKQSHRESVFVLFVKYVYQGSQDRIA